MRILVTGATGYIGGRLVPRLLDAGHEVRCLARNPQKLSLHPWRHRVEVVAGDVLDERSVKEALIGCDAAVYLVHSMASGADFARVDRRAASNFRNAAADAAVGRIVYLGALGDDRTAHSRHLSSRHEVGRALAAGPTPVTEVRAAVIIGSGSLSFEMLRSLTEVLPVMITPRWVRTRCQPVAVGDVLEILRGAIEDRSAESRILEVGGPDVLTYEQMMQIYAEEAGLRRRVVIPVPLLTPWLSSWWIGLVTPLPPKVARPLVESLRSEVVVGRSQDLVPLEPTPIRAAMRRALSRLPGGVITRWSDAASQPAAPIPTDPAWSGGTVFMDRQVMPTDTDASHLFWAFSRIGGRAGYYGLDWAWRIRGILDRMVGGTGLRRGRRHPTEVRVGEAVDFWRVEDVVPGRSLRLHAEMRIPGDAWIEWEIRDTEFGTDLIQTAWFRPRGLAGRIYWYLMLVPHRIVFPRMAHRITAAAEERGFTCR
ncbi:MAG: SDR family oxidoreductase [Acidimicrobiia bacterium]|nr:SDR family oxidoreductase [Acidimicrobiia bacterium]